MLILMMIMMIYSLTLLFESIKSIYNENRHKVIGPEVEKIKRLEV